MKTKHKEIYAIVAEDEGIVVVGGIMNFPTPCVALTKKAIDHCMKRCKFGKSQGELPKGKKLLLVKFSSPEILEVLEG